MELVVALLFLILLVLILGRHTVAWLIVIGIVVGSLIWQPQNKNAVITLAIITVAVMTARKIYQWRR